MRLIPNFILVSLIIFASCSENKESVLLNEQEMFFRETLVSISEGTGSDNLYYIGTEFGTVFVYNSESNHIDTLKTEFGRIYKVVKDPNNSDIYWLGVKNGGLRKCCIEKDSLVDINQGYNLANKGTQYSCYDIVIHFPYVYMATSQGLFAVENDTIIKICCKEDSSLHGKGLMPFSVTHLTKNKDSLLFFTSDDGVLKINLKDGLKYNPTAIKSKSSKVFVIGEKGYLLLKDTLYICDSNITHVDNCIPSGLNDIQTFYKANDICYFIGSQTLAAIPDSLLNCPKQYKKMQLRMRARTDCYNVIVDDIAHNQSLLITENALLKLPYHISGINEIGPISFTCQDGDNFYYLIDGNKLFKQSGNNTNPEQIYVLPKGRKAQTMTVTNNVLYYADMQRKIWKVELRESFYLNTIFAFEDIVTDTIRRRITALTTYRGKTLMGIQDGIVSLNNIRTKQFKNMEEILGSSYITRFTNIGDSLLYVSTLNDGIFVVKGDSPNLRNIIDSISFVQDVALGNRLYFLTNHKIYQQQDDSFTEKCRTATGFNRLFVTENQHLLGIGTFGIMDFTDSTSYLTDVKFEPNACLTFKGRLYVGGPIGMFFFDNTMSPHAIQFIAKSELFTRNNILMLVTLILIVIVALWWLDKHRMSQRALQTYRDGLLMRLDRLIAVKENLNREIASQIDTLQASVESIDLTGKKESLEILREKSLNIMSLTSKIPSMLVLTLNNQLEQIRKLRFGDYEKYINNTNEAVKAHTLLGLSKQIKLNADWLERKRHASSILSGYEVLSKELPLIVGVTEEIKATIHSSKSPEEKLTEAEHFISRLNDETAIERINSYVKRRLYECSELLDVLKKETESNETEKVTLLILIKENYEKITKALKVSDSNKVEIMRKIFTQDRQIDLINILISIRSQLEGYDSKLHHLSKKLDEFRYKKKRGEYVLDESKRRRDNTEITELQNQLAKMEEGIKTETDNFYVKYSMMPEENIFDVIGLRLKSGEGQFLMAYVLAIMMCGTNVPISRFGALFNVNEQSIRRVKRDVKVKIKAHINEIIDYTKTNPISIAVILLKLAGTSAQDSSEDVTK